jgi:hypothetical protein
VGVVIVGALGVVGLARAVRPKGPIISLVLLASPGNEMEARIWLSKLRTAGIRVHPKENSVPPWRMGWGAFLGGSGYYSEFWVKESDYEDARQLLGFRTTV